MKSSLLSAVAYVALVSAANAATPVRLNSVTGNGSFCSDAGCVSISGGVISGSGSFSETLNLTPGIFQFSYDNYVEGNGPARSAAGFDGTIVQDTSAAPDFSPRSFLLANTGGLAAVQFATRNETRASGFNNISVVQIDDGLGNNIGAAAQAVAAEGSRQLLGAIFGRFASPGTGTADMASAPQATQVAGPGRPSGSKYRAWINGHYGETDWDQSSTDSNTQGVNLGFEFDASSDWTLGAAIGVSTADFGTVTPFTVNRGYADQLIGAVYAQWAPQSSPYYATSALGYGVDTSDVFRHSTFGLGTVGAQDIDTSQWFGALEAGFNWQVASSTMLTPFARVEGGQIDQDGYAESPISGILVPAVVASTDADALRTLLGVRGSTGFNFLGAKWRALGHVAWQHEFELDRGVGFAESAGFGTTFAGVSSAGAPGEDAVAFGAGIDVAVTDTVNLFVKYDGLSGDGQETHEGQVGMRFTW